MSEDAVVTQLNVIARLLETAGYAVEVDYPSATIIVWLEEWPVSLEVKRRSER